MNALFAAHSGLRYLVLLAGVVALVVFAIGQAQRKDFTRGARVVGSVFSSLLELQVLLGLGLVVLGRWSPIVIGHLVCMLLAVGSARGLQIANRKRPKPGYVLPLMAVALALLFIVGGIMALGRMPFTSTVGS